MAPMNSNQKSSLVFYLISLPDFREKLDEVREKLEKLVARTSSSLGSRIDRVRKDGAQNKDDIAAVRFEVSRAKANSRRERKE